MVGNYSFTQTKYSNECFNIIYNEIHSDKNTTQYTPVLYEYLTLEIKVNIFTRSDKVKCRTLTILLDCGTSAKIVSVRLIPKAWRKKNTTTKWDTRGTVFKIKLKQLYRFNFQS